MSKLRTAILISGRGSNMMALVEAARAPDFPAEIVAVITNRPGAAGLAWAQSQGLPTAVVDHTTFAGKPAFEAALDSALGHVRAEAVCLAGFMRLLSAEIVARWENRILNIHPSLLPAFKGLDTHARALASGVRITGCTVHLVSAEMDAGPIVAQAAVPVLAGDTEATLSARVLAAEHRIYPEALRRFALGQIRIEHGRAIVSGGVNQPSVLYSPALACSVT